MPVYRITDLVDATGFSERTIRLYRTKRILPPPKGGRRAAYWTRDHLRILLELRDKREGYNRLIDDADFFQSDPRFAHLYPANERSPGLDDD